MKRNERTNRSLIINCLAGLLAAVITVLFMTFGAPRTSTWLQSP